MSSNQLAPNSLLYSAFWRESAGAWQQIAMHNIAVPRAMRTENAEQVLNGDVQGQLVVKRPISTGSITLSAIQARATSYTIVDAVLAINGGSATTPVNASIARTVPAEIRLFDLKVVHNGREIAGSNWYEIMTGVEWQIPATDAAADSGNTLEVPIIVWGTITRTYV